MLERRPGIGEEYERPNIERIFWKGNDFAVSKSASIPARRPGLVSVTIDPSNLLSKDPAIIERLNATMRSGLAMRGGDIDELGKQLIRFTEVNGIQIGSDPFDADVVMNNYSERELIITAGMDIARPFFQGSESAIEGEELVALIKSGEINLGEEGTHWVYRKHNGVQTGAFLKINPDNRQWTGDSTVPLIYNESVGFGDRERLKKLLTPVPMGIQRQILWIGETQAIVHLKDPQINAVLHAGVIGNTNGKPQVVGAHINSHVLDGKRTDRVVRLEILSSTIPEKMPDQVYATFAREDSIAA